jgi:crotonobetainyl-CoA:carnitine CoA-transferase CaiB-like acyl-CoA transferase
MTADAPLKGLKVLELARILAGPWIGQTLADLGAEVIKIESPEGDDTRRWGPPWISARGEEAAAYFHACNRGKRSVVLDLKTEEGREAARRLAGEADVLIENFKRGGLEKYGLDYAALKPANPGLVYCSITGFGQTGPYADRPGYDFIIQGMGGLMSVTGEADRPPQKVGVAIADLVTGLYGVIAVQAALAQRARTGEGQQIDLALLDCLSGVLANQAMNYFATGESPKRHGPGHANIVPYQVFETADGHLILAVGNDGQFAKLCAVLELDLAQDERFATNPARLVHREVLVPMIEARTRAFTRDALLAACEAAGVPAGPINTLEDVFADPQVQARGMKITPQGVPGLRSPLNFSGAELALDRPSPRLGEHTEEVLAEIGLSP